jgi:hypothetical protein
MTVRLVDFRWTLFLEGSWFAVRIVNDKLNIAQSIKLVWPHRTLRRLLAMSDRIPRHYDVRAMYEAALRRCVEHCNDERPPGSPSTVSPTNPANITDTQAAVEALALAPPLDFLSQAVRQLRPFLDRSTPVGERLRCLWAGVVAARDLGANDVVEAEFLKLARETGLYVDVGRHADEDLRHVIRWAMRNQNPFYP